MGLIQQTFLLKLLIVDKELLLLERFLTTEISMLHGYFMFLHQNRELTSYMRVVP